MHACLKCTDWPIIKLVISVVEHSLLVKIFSIHPLERNLLRRVELVAPADLELEAIFHVARGIDQDAGCPVGVRGYPERPVVFEWGAVVDHQFHQE